MELTKNEEELLEYLSNEPKTFKQIKQNTTLNRKQIKYAEKRLENENLLKVRLNQNNEHEYLLKQKGQQLSKEIKTEQPEKEPTLIQRIIQKIKPN